MQTEKTVNGGRNRCAAGSSPAPLLFLYVLCPALGPQPEI